jgi:SAM-dependent methyltransferase
MGLDPIGSPLWHTGAMNKPYSDACDQNKTPILAVIAPLFREVSRVLEVGSGTGQHAVHFAAALPHLIWQTSDVPANLPGIRLWLAEAALPNLPPPLPLDVLGDWPAGPFGGVFSANTAHIMGEREVAAMFLGVGQVLSPGGRFALYGPFRVAGRHTSESNARFDAALRARDPRMGVRDLEDLQRWGEDAGLRLMDDVTMPVNNRTLMWVKSGE